MAIALSVVPLDTAGDIAGSRARDEQRVLMAIITDLTYRKAAEATRARLLERLISAEDEERRRIARELHDEAGQSLTAIMVGLRAIADMAVTADVRSAALRLRDVAAHTVDDIGRLARGLHPAVLDDKGLAAAAKRYVADFARTFGVAVDLTDGTTGLAPAHADDGRDDVSNPPGMPDQRGAARERQARVGRAQARRPPDRVRRSGRRHRVRDVSSAAMGLGCAACVSASRSRGASIEVESSARSWGNDSRSAARRIACPFAGGGEESGARALDGMLKP